MYKLEKLVQLVGVQDDYLRFNSHRMGSNNIPYVTQWWWFHSALFSPIRATFMRLMNRYRRLCHELPHGKDSNSPHGGSLCDLFKRITSIKDVVNDSVRTWFCYINLSMSLFCYCIILTEILLQTDYSLVVSRNKLTTRVTSICT